MKSLLAVIFCWHGIQKVREIWRELMGLKRGEKSVNNEKILSRPADSFSFLQPPTHCSKKISNMFYWNLTCDGGSVMVLHNNSLYSMCL